MSLGNLQDRLSLSDLGSLQEFDFLTALEIDDEVELFADVAFEQFPFAPVLATASSASLVDFAVTVVNAADAAFDVFIEDLAAVAAAGFEEWGQFLAGAEGAQIDIAVTIADLPGSAVAGATAGGFFFSGAEINGITEVLTVSQIELAFGVDLNGDTPDIVITVDTDFLAAASFDTSPDRMAVPGVLDFVSVLAHEIGHGLGFLGFAGNDGSRFMLDVDGDGITEAVDTSYGTLVDFEDLGDPFLTPTFFGANAVEVYGEPVVLENTFESPGSDVSHFALFDPDGSIADTALAIMNPVVIPGDIVTVGAFELAVLADIGIDVAVPGDLGLVNELDALPFTPTVSVAPALAVNDAGEVIVTVQLDAPSLFFTLPTSVGVSITGADGTTITQRVEFAPGGTSVDIVVDPTAVFTAADGAITGDVDVEIFFPAQAQLASGETSETVTLSADFDVDAIFGTDGADSLAFGSGSQTVFGGEGDDFISTGSGADTIFGGEGDDTLFGGSSRDTIDGGAGNDVIDGGSSADVIFGGDGNDDISGGSSRDTIDGGAGDDVISGGSSSDTILGGAGNDDISGGSGADNIDGGGGADIISGGSGADFIDGSTGDDSINGGSGADTIVGGGGDDTLTGGSGGDTFIIGASFFDDNDVITDFSDSSDTLILDGFGFESVADVLAAAVEFAGGVAIILTPDADTTQTLILLGIDLEGLASSDIGFDATAVSGGGVGSSIGGASAVLPPIEDLFAFSDFSEDMLLL